MKCIIIDDEPIARKGMKRLVDAHPELKLQEMFENAENAASWLKHNTTDLIFLDIEMSGINGIEFAKQLPPEHMVIFTTAYSEYALDSYDVEAIDYIVKSERKYVRIKLNNIIYIEGLKDYVIIHLSDKKVVTRMIVKSMEEILPKHQFIRISKSYIVNKDKIEAFDNKDIVIGTTELAIGASYRDEVLNKLLR